jgi:hypothetical protein
MSYLFVFSLVPFIKAYFKKGRELSNSINNVTKTTENVTKTTENGRLGNHIIKNLAVSFIAEKYDLKVDYFNNELIKNLGINLFSGNNSYDCCEILNDDNYLSIYNRGYLNCNLQSNSSFFQTKEIINMIYRYLQKDEIMINIIINNPFNNRYNSNNDLFVHIRLGDVESYNPGIDYYMNTIKLIQFDKMYVSSDTINHSIINRIINKYPNTEIINYDEIKTFQFASTCKNVILSHGSFSSIIGYLSFFSNVYYPEIDPNKVWHGDLFSIEKWNKVNWIDRKSQ